MVPELVPVPPSSVWRLLSDASARVPDTAGHASAVVFAGGGGSTGTP